MEKECSTATIHQPCWGAGSAEWTGGWHRCRLQSMVDDIVRALAGSQGFCLLFAMDQEKNLSCISVVLQYLRAGHDTVLYESIVLCSSVISSFVLTCYSVTQNSEKFVFSFVLRWMTVKGKRSNVKHLWKVFGIDSQTLWKSTGGFTLNFAWRCFSC